MATILVTEFMDESALGLAGDHRVVVDAGLHADRARLIDLVADVDAVIVRNKTQVDRELLNAAKALKVVGRLGVGLDNIDLEACAERGVAVRPATGANTVAVAEYVLGAMLTLRRGTYGSTDRITAGEWPRTALMGRELAGATLGLVGYGQIAKAVAVRAAAFGMEIIAHDPYLLAGADWFPAVPSTLDAVLTEADVVSLHVPLVPETRGLIGDEVIARMRPGSIVINTSRGGIVDETAVVSALRRGQLGGAALDVYSSEPPSPELRATLAETPNLLLTPHVAGVTVEANVRVSRVTVEAVLEELAR